MVMDREGHLLVLRGGEVVELHQATEVLRVCQQDLSVALYSNCLVVVALVVVAHFNVIGGPSRFS